MTPSPRALLEGLALNTHLNDLHLDLSACEVSSPSGAAGLALGAGGCERERWTVGLLILPTCGLLA